jgi:hypothetical protein
MEMLTEQQEPYNISSVISTHPDPVKRGLTEYEVLCGSQSILPWFGPHVPSVEYTFARLINSSVEERVERIKVQITACRSLAPKSDADQQVYTLVRNLPVGACPISREDCCPLTLLLSSAGLLNILCSPVRWNHMKAERARS